MVKKILILTPTFSPDVGGVETMLTGFCSYLSEHQFQVNVLTYKPLIVKAHAPWRQRLSQHITVWRIPWIGLGLFNIFERLAFIQFFYLVPGLLLATFLFLLRKSNRPELIHTFGLSGAFAGGLACRIFNIPCLADMCTVYRLSKRPILARLARILLNWSDYIRGNNPAGKEELLNIGLCSEKVGMITPPVDEKVFKPLLQNEARLRLSLPEKSFIALFVGRMVAGKGVEIAVSATRLVKNPWVRFVFVGEGPLRYLVENVATADQRIYLVGNVAHHDLVYYYNAADILICAPVDSELIAFVGREALMCALPILAPNVAVYFGLPRRVNPELIPPNAGRLLKPTAQALAACLEELVHCKQSQGRWPFDQGACRDYAVAHFSPNAMEWIKDAYQRAIQNHQTKAERRGSVQ